MQTQTQNCYTLTHDAKIVNSLIQHPDQNVSLTLATGCFKTGVTTW